MGWIRDATKAIFPTRSLALQDCATDFGDGRLAAAGRSGIGVAANRRSRPWRSISMPMLCGGLACADAASILLAGLLALLIYADPVYVAQSGAIYLTLSLTGAGGMALLGRACGLYRGEVIHTPFLRPWQALGCWTVTVFVLLGAVFFFHDAEHVSRAWVGFWFGFAAAGLCLGRVALRARIAWWRAQGWMHKRVVVVGPAAAALATVARLEQGGPSDFYHVVAAFDDASAPAPAASPDRRELLPAAALVAFLRATPIEQVLICCGAQPDPALGRIALDLAELPVEVLLCPDYSGFALPVMAARQIGGLSLLQVSRPPLSERARVVKGLEDRIVASLMLLALAPVMLAAALAIKLDSPGPALFRQQRFGFNNRPIWVLKFRTMRHDLGDASGARRTVRGDRRVTRVGRMLRRTSIDELPQLLNVLRGEMSLVGPRAHPIAMKVTDQLYHEAVSGYAARHRVKPGITGLAQINGNRGEVDTLEKAQARIRYDLDYVARWSLWLDLKILLLTPIRALHKGY